MNIFKKKDSKHVMTAPDGEMVPLRKKLQSASLEPIPYEHTEKFKKDGENPIDMEREMLSHKSVDWLLKEQRVPSIEADTKLEIENGKRQYSDHIYACRKVLDLERGELRLVYDMKETVQKEIKEYDDLKDELLSKCRRFS